MRREGGEGRKDRGAAHGTSEPRRRIATGPMKKRIRELESAVAKLETEIAEIDAKLSEPDLHARKPYDAARFAKAREAAAQALVQAEEEWLALSSELEAAGS